MGGGYSRHIKKKIDMFNTVMESRGNTNIRRSLYFEMIAEIFGHGGKIGFDLHRIDYSSRPVDHDTVFRFLHPLGPFFKLCYILCSGSATYDFPISYVPLGMREEILNQTCSNFYRLKMRMHPETKEVVSLIFNPFEYYMFHFISYLITYREYELSGTPLTVKECEATKRATLYMRLCEEYIRFFIPCDCEDVQKGILESLKYPSVPFSPPSNSWNPSLIRPSVPNTFLETCFETENSSAIWKTYVFLLMTIDIWVGIPKCCITHSGQYYLPTPANICIVRYLVKHLHFFANSCSGSKMDTFRREIFSMLGQKIYYFIKTTIVHWPHDATFSIILETWLTFIQPWRYVSSSSPSVSESSREASQYQVERKWISFIAEHFIFYTHIFQLVLRHFRNEDLSMLRNVCLLIRPLKIYVVTGLAELVEEVEMRVLNDSSIRSRWAESMQLQFYQQEGTSFQYTPVFDRAFSSDVQTIFESLSLAKRIMKRKTNSNLSRLKRYYRIVWLFGQEDENDALLMRLTSAMRLISTLYKFSTPEDHDENSLAMFSFSRAYLKNHSIYLASHSNYSGEPELLPVQSYEIGVLVRFLYDFSTWINHNYSEIVSSLYGQRGYTRKLVRQVILEPIEVMHHDKARGIFHPHVVSRELPPRISLRPLANKKMYMNSLICLALSILCGVPFINSVLCLVGICLTYFVCRPLVLH